MLRGGLPGARWVEPDNYHLTLRFIGDVDGALAHDVASILGNVARRAIRSTARRAVVLRRAQTTRRGRGRRPTPPLYDLQSEHERLMQRIGLAPEGRKYTPHVTLARLRDTSSRQVADYLAVRQPYRSTTFRASRFVLFSSRTSIGGGPYVVEAAYALAD